MQTVHLFTILSLAATASEHRQQEIVNTLAQHYLPKTAHAWFAFLNHPHADLLMTNSAIRIQCFAEWFVAQANRWGIPADCYARLFTFHSAPPQMLSHEHIDSLTVDTLAILGAYNAIPDEHYTEAFRRLVVSSVDASTFAAYYWRKADPKRFYTLLIKFAEGELEKVYTIPALADYLFQAAVTKRQAIQLRKGVITTDNFTLSTFLTGKEIAEAAFKVWNEWIEFSELEKARWALHAEQRIYGALLAEIRKLGSESIQQISNTLKPMALARVIDDFGFLSEEDILRISRAYSEKDVFTLLISAEHIPASLCSTLLDRLGGETIYEAVLTKPALGRRLGHVARNRYKIVALEVLNKIDAEKRELTQENLFLKTFLRTFAPSLDILVEIGRLSSAGASEVFLHYLDLLKNDLDMNNFNAIYRELSGINKGIALVYVYKHRLFPEKFILQHFASSEWLTRAVFALFMFPRDKIETYLPSLQEQLTGTDALELAQTLVRMESHGHYDIVRKLILAKLDALSRHPNAQNLFSSIPYVLMKANKNKNKDGVIEFLKAVLKAYAQVGDVLPDNMLQAIASFSGPMRKNLGRSLAMFSPHWYAYASAFGVREIHCNGKPENFIEKAIHANFILQKQTSEKDPTYLDKLVSELEAWHEAKEWIKDATDRLRFLLNTQQVRKISAVKQQPMLRR